MITFTDLFVTFVIGVMSGCILMCHAWKYISVEAGHAEYVLKDNKAVWQWKEISK